LFNETALLFYPFDNQFVRILHINALEIDDFLCEKALLVNGANHLGIFADDAMFQTGLVVILMSKHFRIYKLEIIQ
jgi:hypothetical protein